MHEKMHTVRALPTLSSIRNVYDMTVSTFVSANFSGQIASLCNSNFPEAGVM